MRNSTLLIIWTFTILLNSCSKQQFTKTDLPDNRLINNIIMGLSDSLNLRKKYDDTLFRKFVLLDSLPYLKIRGFKEKGFAPAEHDEFFIDFLTVHKEYRIDNQPIFSKIDSSFFRYQELMKKEYTIDKEILDSILFINNSQFKQERTKFEQLADKSAYRRTGKYFWWIKIYAPLVSRDKKYSLVGINAGCLSHSCGFGAIAILRNESSNWKVVKIDYTYAQ